MDDFFAEGYEIPKMPGNYMKLEDGANKFRILSRPIVGWEYWEKNPQRKPVRVEYTQEAYDLATQAVIKNIDPKDRAIKHFWAFIVYNYQDKKIQILEITSKTIQQGIHALGKSEDWGSPLNYDITIKKTGKDLQTEYIVTPSPHKELDYDIQKLFENTPVNIEGLFLGTDPFEV